MGLELDSHVFTVYCYGPTPNTDCVPQYFLMFSVSFFSNTTSSAHPEEARACRHAEQRAL